MKLIIGVLDTNLRVYGPRPEYGAYVQIWRDRPLGNRIVCSHQFDDLTYAQWQRFRRLQDALARVPAADLTDEQRAEYEALQREAIGRRRAIEARIRRPKEAA